jgi:cell division protein FtsL
MKIPGPAAAPADKPAKAARNAENTFANILCLVIGLALAFVLLTRAAVITQKAHELDDKKAEVAVLRDRITKKQMELESKIDLKTVEHIARVKLGMRRAEKFQTVYICSAREDRGEVVKPSRTGLLASIRHFTGNMLEYIR